MIALFVLGFPLLGLEFFIGQNARYELIGATAKVHPRAFGIGVVAPIASFGILLTYNVRGVNLRSNANVHICLRKLNPRIILTALSEGTGNNGLVLGDAFL